MLRKEKNLEKVEYRKLTGEDNLGKEATGRQPIIRGIQNFAIGPFDKVVRIEFDLCGRKAAVMIQIPFIPEETLPFEVLVRKFHTTRQILLLC